MKRRLIFNPKIPDDLAIALRHYDAISIELGNRFRHQVDRKLNVIAERPESFGVDQEPVRVAKVDRFPYLIFFEVKPEFVSIIAITHGASNPVDWRHRD